MYSKVTYSYNVGGGGGETETDCPTTYRYAFRRGKYCCRTNKDTNGGTLTINSNSCQHDAYRPCPGTKCKTNGGIV